MLIFSMKGMGMGMGMRMRIKMKTYILPLFMIIIGCSSHNNESGTGGNDSQEYLCIPDDQEDCRCDNGDQGYQTCNEDGMSFDSCKCENYVEKCNKLNEFLGEGTNKTHCYRYHLLAIPGYETSMYECRIWGGELVAVNSQEEFDFINNYLYSPPLGQNYIHESGVWIGAIDRYPYTGNVANYTWSNGDLWGIDGWGMNAGSFPWKLNNPAIGEPCTSLFYEGFESKTCTIHDDVLGYVCEKQL